MLFGWPGAAAASLIGALMPWHLEFSRYGIEATAASATVTIAITCFFLWLERRRDRWLLQSGLWFGFSLYTYAITKVTVPLLIGLLAILYWRDCLNPDGTDALVCNGGCDPTVVFDGTPALVGSILKTQRVGTGPAAVTETNLFSRRNAGCTGARHCVPFLFGECP